MQFIPLDTVRLLDSNLFAISTGDEFKAAVALWCKAWQQVPASSLPNDERVLSHLSGAGKRWSKLRDVALRGFVLCDDGRLYHPVIAEKAREAWTHRVKQRANANKRWQSHGNAMAYAVAMQGTVTGTVKVNQDQHLLSGKPDDTSKKPKKINGNRAYTAAAKTILAFLNDKAGKQFPESDSNLGIIVARLNEGFTADQIRAVVAMKIRKWKGDDEMSEYLRPETLFGRKKFSNYVGELKPDDVSEDELPGL